MNFLLPYAAAPNTSVPNVARDYFFHAKTQRSKDARPCFFLLKHYFFSILPNNSSLRPCSFASLRDTNQYTHEATISNHTTFLSAQHHLPLPSPAQSHPRTQYSTYTSPEEAHTCSHRNFPAFSTAHAMPPVPVLQLPTALQLH